MLARLLLLALTLTSLAGCIPDGADGQPLATTTPAELGLTLYEPEAGPIVLDLVAEEAGRDVRPGAAWVAIGADRPVQILDIRIDGDAGRCLPYVMEDGQEVAPPVDPGWGLTVIPPSVEEDGDRSGPPFYRHSVDRILGQRHGEAVRVDMVAHDVLAIEVAHENPGRIFALTDDPIGGHLLIETTDGVAALPIVTLRGRVQQ